MTALQNKTALVTGASRGIGRATALALAEAGAHVLVHYGRSRQEAESLVGEIRMKGGHAYVRKAMNNTLSNGKEIKIPGPDHPIAISPVEGKVRVTAAGRIVAESTRALRLEEKGYSPVYYLPRNDADMSLLLRTMHYTYCPYKGDCTYYSIPVGGTKSDYAVWTYEKPHEAVADIKGHLAFYPTRVDAIEVIA